MAQEFSGDRNDFLAILKSNQGVMIFKYTADWCKPCKTIKTLVDSHFETLSSENTRCFEVDIDDNFDLFAYMKTKKMMKGIPTLMAYKQGTTSFIPDDSISGTDVNEIIAFFSRCRKM
jgi:thiol-disulfide isomerase/thioredoxin